MEYKELFEKYQALLAENSILKEELRNLKGQLGIVECQVVSSGVNHHDNHENYTFYADIGKQEPALGEDPECIDNPILVGVEWRPLDSLCERDRAYLWAAGLFYVSEFAEELNSWGDDISYPSKRGISG